MSLFCLRYVQVQRSLSISDHWSTNEMPSRSRTVKVADNVKVMWQRVKVKVTECVNQSKPMPLSGITAKGRLVAAGSKINVIRSRSRRSRSW